MTKLYTVTFEVEYVIAVEEGQEPEAVAGDTVREALRDYDVEPHHFYIYETNSLPDGWNDECYPYAVGTQDKTIKEIVEGATND